MEIPETMTGWNLYGEGFERLGREGRPETLPVPAFGANELLARSDVCGLCFSDTKVIALGGNHPRLVGRDLTAQPVTLGHEVAVTIVGVGAALQGKYHVGERFVVQPDVFYGGRGVAYGYAIAGGLSEYSVIPEAILNGDEGCYLLPVRAQTGYVEAALTEPWACVTAAYNQAHRDGIKRGGQILIIGGEDGEEREYDWRDLFAPDRLPARISLWRVSGKVREALETWIAQTAETGLAQSVVSITDAAEAGELTQQFADVRFDDILIMGNAAPEVIEQAATLLADHGILNLVCDRSVSRPLALDIGRIHYNWHHYIGTDTNRPAAAYRETRTAELAAGGVCWFVGAGGPMGQMHVQRALQHPNPPRRIVATDVDAARLQSVVDRFGAIADARDIELFALNPATMDKIAFDAELRRLSDTGNRQGFDDIVSLVPSADVTAHAAQFLAAGGWLNIFAGVARGTMANLDVNRLAQDHCRIVGSTGSSLADMRETLNRVERGELATNTSLAAIGGLEAALEGLEAVKAGRFAGKTLIFPQIHHLPLTPLAELETTLPTVYANLKDGQFWTNEAEAELMRLKM